MKKGFKLNGEKKFFNILLNREFVKFFGYRNKIQVLTEDGFLCVGKRKIFCNSNYGSKTFNCSSLWALIWCKWLKSLELTSWILVRIDCTKIAGQILTVQSDIVELRLVEVVTFFAHSSDSNPHNLT